MTPSSQSIAAQARELWGKQPLRSKNTGSVAEHYLKHLRPNLIYFNDEHLDWDGAGYSVLDVRQVRSDIVNAYDGFPISGPDGKLTSWSATPSSIAGVLENVNGRILQSRIGRDLPFWLASSPGMPGQRIAFRNGLLDVATSELIPPTPDYINTNMLPYAYDPDVRTTPGFDAFLDEPFEYDPKGRHLLQEWFGYCRTSDTSHQKLMLILGPRRSGKGTIGRVLQQLVGPANAVSPKLRQIGQTFGMQQLIRKTIAFCFEARVPSRDERYAIAENLLSIVGEDPQSIDRKNQTAWQGTLRRRVTLMSNEVPDLPDPAQALEARYLIIKLSQSFAGKEQRDLDARLQDELPGIMNWSLEGLRLLNANGHFARADDADIRDLITDTPLKRFVLAECNLSTTARCDKNELFRRFKAWSREAGSPVSSGMQLQHFGRRLFEEFPQVRGAKSAKSEHVVVSPT